ncbi:non-hydrolyzing UDP-N-acetylglucosamine 2-epimerase [Enterococcus casseliflavus]|uniref:non-hydrolyzing UDP-N-acetylglucosamine 2-epimerase n=1 Tax=Enterococcus casseliflavus TaxID=37734 RepID=UPI0014330CCA|nr:UDP-N-acetylglucosamine 2-epimerase (non-hydrolyzing) [Enterococcus casseliflavus]NKD32809.1 UDP-N-acetylglucosamine 2-epimerase (non-hydrolyzing) [Enterococcus casseliflavus]
MGKKYKVMSIVGTRPEAIKMAPVIKSLEIDTRFNSSVIVTGQHREMLDQVLNIFDIRPNYDLNIMEMKQSLTGITTKILIGLEKILSIEKPDIVLVHGDTTTALAAALAAFYQNIPIGHVEAGLRTWNMLSPFPEEANRQLIDVLSNYYFAPTKESKKNLLKENHSQNKIYVTGNTAIDSMNYTISSSYQNKILDAIKGKIILVTMHRRENIGSPMLQVFKALYKLSQEKDDIHIIFPMHRNPKVRELASSILGNLKNVSLIEPLDVIDFHNFANRSTLILTDSGGVQEEAPSLGVPVLVLRDTTERPEGVAAGTLKLIGTKFEDVYRETKELLENKVAYDQMAHSENPYGDGKSSLRIIEHINSILSDLNS